MKFLPVIIVLLFSLSSDQLTPVEGFQNNQSQVKCTKDGCKGTYKGPEFINGSDVAHQFSNTMSKDVGDALKEEYRKGNYVKVDFDQIEMTTEGMGSGKVTYYLSVPFISVRTKCDAYTSFDHVGGWNHAPALERRKQELAGVLMKGHELNISELKQTAEGLQEYWIQWKNKIVQADCE